MRAAGAGRRADVVVVGAGPAGSATAWRLARAGASVLLLDARSFPRSKPCGDAVSPGATPLLRAMGVAERLPAEGTAHILGWRIRAPGGRWTEGAFRAADPSIPARGLCVSRRILDAHLLEAAVRAGAVFLPGHRVFRLLDGAGRPLSASGGTAGERGRAGGRTAGVVARGPDGRARSFRARLVVGADGLRSRVARLLGGVRRGRRERLAVVGRFERPEDGAPRRWGQLRLAPDGVLGLAPLGGGGFNATVVVPASRAPEMAAGLEAFYRRRLAHHGAADLLRRARRREPLQVTGPFQVTPRRTTRPGALLVGDAAGYFDPLTGQGVHRALAGARLAARRALEALERPAAEPEALAAYERELDALLRPGRRVQRLVDAVAFRPALMDPLARLLEARPGLASLLVDVTGDRLPPGALLRPGRLLEALRATATEASRPDRPGPSSPHRPARRAVPAQEANRAHA